MPNEPTDWDYISQTNAALTRRGLIPENITAERERFTGHTRRIREPWIRTIGMWGGVVPLSEIAFFVGKDAMEVKAYASSRGLSYRTLRLRRTQAQLAVLAFLTQPAPAKEVAPRLGLFPFEVVLYRLCGNELTYYGDPHEILLWSPERLEETWHEAGLVVCLPESFGSPRWRPAAPEPELRLDAMSREERHALYERVVAEVKAAHAEGIRR